MKKTILTIAFLTTALLATLRAQTEMYINNPDLWWWHQPCTIEEASMTVAPHGLYMEVGLFLTLGGGDIDIAPNDSLEIVMNFTLPEGALIVDSWLWIGDDIIRAAILDRWTATTIYESIVDRRQDPSILARVENNSYSLNIYPLVADQPRKIKITYLVPVQWTKEEVTASLPLEILAASATPVNNVKMQVAADAIWGTPRFKGVVGAPTAVWDEIATGLWETRLPNVPNFKLALDAPLNNGVFVSVLPAEGPDYYQMAILPQEVFGLQTAGNKKLLVAMEYHDNNSPFLSKAAMLNEVKQQLLATLSANDYFNLVVTDQLGSGQFSPYFFSPHWVPAHPDSIEAAFAAIANFSNNSNLPGLLSEGISFIQDQGGEGELILFANSDQLATSTLANPVISALDDLMGDVLIPIHICDFQTTEFDGFWIASENRLYRGNEYFYSNLARLSGGNYFNQIVCCPSFQENAQQVFEVQKTFPGYIDIYTGLENGFSFQRYNSGVSSGLTDLKKPILQVGRIQGTGAFRIEANIEYNGTFESQEILLTGDLSTNADSMIREMWAGNHLAFLDAQASTYASIHEAIDFSISERVLGDYTAFLCLEPSLGGEPCPTCEIEEEVTVDTDPPLVLEELSCTAFPNPFTDRLTIDLTLPENIAADDCSLTLFDATGRVVRQFGRQDMSGTGQDWQLVWDARNENGLPVPAGMYVLVLSTPHGKHHLKVMCAR